MIIYIWLFIFIIVLGFALYFFVFSADEDEEPVTPTGLTLPTKVDSITTEKIESYTFDYDTDVNENIQVKVNVTLPTDDTEWSNVNFIRAEWWAMCGDNGHKKYKVSTLENASEVTNNSHTFTLRNTDGTTGDCDEFDLLDSYIRFVYNMKNSVDDDDEPTILSLLLEDEGSNEVDLSLDDELLPSGMQVALFSRTGKVISDLTSREI